MIRHRRIVLVVLICIVSLLFISCGKVEQESVETDSPYKMFLKGIDTNDSESLDQVITKAYGLKELQDFFSNANMNENLGFEVNTPTICFEEVNRQYPVEITRSNGYSVYKVREGGYFYVFWAGTDDETGSGEVKDPVVYFTAYLSASKNKEVFDSIQVGVSTAADVKKIDPSFELTFLRSNGIYSYGYLNSGELLEIRHSVPDDEEWDGYEDLIVERISVVPRIEGACCYGSIRQNDLPC